MSDDMGLRSPLHPQKEYTPEDKEAYEERRRKLNERAIMCGRVHGHLTVIDGGISLRESRDTQH